MQLMGGVRIEVEKDEHGGAKTRWVLKADWTPPGFVERQLILDTSESGWEISYKLGAVDAMLRQAYQQGGITLRSGSAKAPA